MLKQAALHFVGEPVIGTEMSADREIARVLGGHLGPDDRLTDEMERRLLQHLTGDRGFRP